MKIDTTVADWQSFKFTGNRAPIKLSFDGEMIFLYATSGTFLGFVASSTSKVLSEIRREFSVHFDAFVLRKDPNGLQHGKDKLVHILLYGQREERNSIEWALSRGDIYLKHPLHYYDTSVEYDNPQYFSRPGEKIEIEIENPDAEKTQTKTISQLLDEVCEIFETPGRVSHGSEVVVSSKLKTKLKEHQKTALAMMLEKEAGKLEGNSFGCLWEVSRSQKGNMQ